MRNEILAMMIGDDDKNDTENVEKKTTIMMMMRMSRLTKEFTPSQHDLDPTFDDKPPAGSRRPARRGL